MPALTRRFAALLLALPCVAFAQAPTAPPPSAPVFGESVEVDVVNVDVVVVDRDGRPVVGLTRDDFELLDDARPVAVEFFAGPEPGAAFVPLPGSPVAGVPALGNSAADAPQRPILVVYVDGLDVRPGPRNDALRRLASLVEDRMIIGHRVVVGVYDQRLRLLTPVTDDRKEVRRAFDQLLGINTGSTVNQTRKRTILSDIQATFASDEAGVLQAQSLLREVETYASAETADRLGAMTALSDLLSTLAGVDGPKTVLHLSAGIKVLPADDLFEAWERRFGSVLDSDIDSRRSGNDPDSQRLQRALIQLTRAAQASRAVIYAIDASDRLPEGFGADDRGEDSTGGSVPGAQAAADASSNLASLADRSGGRRILAGPGLTAELGDVASELASTYSLGFTPTGTPDDKLHEITVRVKREGVRVRHRDSYRRRSAEDELGDSAVAAASFGSAPNPLSARLEVAIGKAVSGRKNAEREVKVLAKVPLTHLTLMPGEGVQSGRLVLELAVRDASGRITRFERSNRTFSFPDEKVAGSAKGLIAYPFELRLAPGSYRLAAALLDTVGGARTATTLDFAVPGNR